MTCSDNAPRGWQKILLCGIWMCFGLMALMPFVVASELAYAFVVGKALYARSIIAVLFCLWVPLALAVPGFRPPRSWILRLLGLGVLAMCVSAWFGVGWQRSLWSNYERMQGIVDAAHWFAFALVLCSVVRTGAQWRRLASLHLAASIAMAGLAALRFFDIDFTWMRDAPELGARIAASLGNSTYLGAYAAANLCIAAALLAWSFAPGGGSSPGAGLRPLWLAAALCNVLSLGFSGWPGSAVGLLGAAGFLALAYALIGRLVVWRRAAVVAVLLAGAGAWVLMLNAEVGEDAGGAGVVLPDWIAGMGSGSDSRRDGEAVRGIAFKAFAERPALGWGPENFIVPFGRYAEGYRSPVLTYDKPSSELLELAVTGGALGIAAHLALWIAMFAVVVRSARSAPPTPDGARAQILTLFVGAALMGDFVTRQVLFSPGVSQMLHLLLLCRVVGLERGAAPLLPAALRSRAAALARSAWARLGVSAAALALGASAIAANLSIHDGASRFLDIAMAGSGEPPDLLQWRQMRNAELAAQAFAPLANGPRRFFIAQARHAWRDVRDGNPVLARSLLERVGRESAAAIALEPENWWVHAEVAAFYLVVAVDDERYREIAEGHRARAMELAPGRVSL